MVTLNCTGEFLYIVKVEFDNSTSYGDSKIFPFSFIEDNQKFLTDPSLAVSILAFIDQTLEVYNIQLQLNREAAEVDKSIWELLGQGAPLSKHTHTNMTNDNLPDQISKDMYYSQDYSCTERSKSVADDIIDEPQNLIFNGKMILQYQRPSIIHQQTLPHFR